MAGNPQLDTFLAEGTPPAPETPQEPPAAEPAPTPASEPTPAPAPPKPDDEDAEPPAAIEGEAVVPRRALEAERHKRQDWKGKAERFEGENAELRRQLEEAKKAPVPAPAPPPVAAPVPLPDPQQDPAGFVQAFAVRQQQMMLNERLNMSEMMLRERLGPEAVDAYVTEFKTAMEADPTLAGKLYAQANPYGWMAKEVDRIRALREVGDDPSKYRERIEAEARARWEAELATRAAPVPQPSPVPPMAPSLATARSVAGRTAPAWTGEPTDDQLISEIRQTRNNRRRA